jgi:DNA-binding NtrC family response regulator
MPQRILVADDDDILLGFIRTVLLKAGYLVDEASGGHKAVALFREHRPDLVLTDLLMPGRDGMEVLRDIRAIDPQAKVIIMSGGGDVVPVGFLDLAPKMGAIGTLAKPFDHRQLLYAVQKVLGHGETNGSAKKTCGGGNAA